jgi:multidrug efflux pump subunit AcrA (membrane-fusion protein)
LEEQPQSAELSRAGNLRVIALVSVVVAILLVVASMIKDRLSPRLPPALPRMVQSSFRPDSEQWKNIMMGTVSSRKFLGLVSTSSAIVADDETIAQGFSPITGNFEKLWLVGDVREEDASQMKLGEAIDVRVAALPGQTFAAKLTFVSSAVDPATRRSAVRAEIANLSGTLKPAMIATMSIPIGADRVSPAVPEIAILYVGNQARVWAYAGEEKLVLRTVKLGRLQDGFMEVLDGLVPGERVALSGNLFRVSSARAD